MVFQKNKISKIWGNYILKSHHFFSVGRRFVVDVKIVCSLCRPIRLCTYTLTPDCAFGIASREKTTAKAPQGPTLSPPKGPTRGSGEPSKGRTQFNELHTLRANATKV